jgi:REP element-mobilizing transposase RayT
MANTFTQIHLHFVFAVKHRNGLIQKTWKARLYEYIIAIVKNKGHKLLAINGMPDHVHMLVGFRPSESISVFMQDVKANSSRWINEHKLSFGKFEWQEGYGAFSYSKEQIPKVATYIQNQEEHHKTTSFLQEYVGFLREFEIDYDAKFIFTEPLD